MIQRLSSRVLLTKSFRYLSSNGRNHCLPIILPQIMEAKEGIIDKWLKKEGEEFKLNERICEVTLDGLTIAVEAPSNGYLSQIFIQSGISVPVGTLLANYTENREDFLNYRESLRIKNMEDNLLADAEMMIDEKNKKPDVKLLLREIKNMIKNGSISDGSGKIVCFLSIDVD